MTKKTILVTKKTNQRLDKFLVLLLKNNSYFKNFSRGDFIRAIKNKEILVNKTDTKPSYIVSVGDLIEINKLNIKKENTLPIPNKKIKLDIIFEDKNILAINKPPQIQVHPDNNEKKNTLLNGLVSQYPKILQLYSKNNIYPGIVHRLDKDTSGVLLIGKNKKTSRALKNLFKQRLITKKYLAIVYGIPRKKSSIINKPLARKNNYKKQVIAGQKTKTKIRNAITKYCFVKKIKDSFSLLEVYPKTGRTHQIRIHLFSIGHPIVGDRLYKNKKQKSIDYNRQLLHAQKIKFYLFNKNYEICAPLPKDFKSFLKDKDFN